MAMMALAVYAGCSTSAVHVDHGLREGSDTEADLVARWAHRWGVRFISKTVDVQDGAGLEASARAARFAELPQNVATGHTMDDQAETVLINMMRGAGVDGMAGMLPGHLHPILGIRKSDTVRLCEMLGVEFFNDPSNSDMSIVRNQVRHHLIPLLNSISGRDTVPVLAKQASIMRDTADYLGRVVDAAEADPQDCSQMRELDPYVAKLLIRSWLRDNETTDVSGGRGGSDRHPPIMSAVDRVMDVVNGRHVGTQVPGGFNVRRTRGRLHISKQD